MKHLRLSTLFIGAGMLAIGAVAGGGWAAQPAQADMDFCNQKATEVTKGTPVQPGVGSTQPGTNTTGGRITDSTQPGTPVQPGVGSTQPGTNTTGGRITDSTQPGTPPSSTGMAPIGETDVKYKEVYLTCLSQRGQ